MRVHLASPEGIGECLIFIDIKHTHIHICARVSHLSLFTPKTSLTEFDRLGACLEKQMSHLGKKVTEVLRLRMR